MSLIVIEDAVREMASQTTMHRMLMECAQGNEEIVAVWQRFSASTECQNCVSYREAAQTFSDALKIHKFALQQPTEKQHDKLLVAWVQFLAGCNVILNFTPPVMSSFLPIMKLAADHKEDFSISCEVLQLDGDIQEAVAAYKKIYAEIVGVKIPLDDEFFAKIFADPASLCIVVKHNSSIIGVLVGLCFSLKVGANSEEALNVLHIFFMGHLVEYPGVHLIERIQELMPGLQQERFPELNVCTLCVAPENKHMIQKYESLGFYQCDAGMNASLGKEILFFRKDLSSNISEYSFAYSDVTKAIKQKRAQILGPILAEKYGLSEPKK